MMACNSCGKEKRIHARGMCSACLQMEYRRKHPDRVAANSKRTYEKHKQRRQAESRNRDALSILHRAFINSSIRRGRASKVTKPEIASMFRVVAGCYMTNCAYCTSLVVAGVNATIDHIVADGGESAENLSIACKSCNSSKQTSSASDFLERMARDEVLRGHIALQNDKLLKLWLVTVMWTGSFEDLVGVLFAPGTDQAVPLGIKGSPIVKISINPPA